jgi:hypothetical protein
MPAVAALSPSMISFGVLFGAQRQYQALYISAGHLV